MSDKGVTEPEEPDEDGDNDDFPINKILEAVNLAVQEAVRAHKRAGNPIATLDDNGQVVWIPPEEIPD